MMELRPRQVDAINLLRQSIVTGHKRPLIQAPTGFGKTLVAAKIVQGARAKGNRVMFVVPAISLINQTMEKFADEGITEIGVIQSNHPATDYSKPVQIASIQTVQNRRHLPDVDLVIVDEAHRWYKFYEKWFDRWDRLIFIGLTATPWTKGLGKHYDDLLIPATIQQLIDEGHLSDFKVLAPSHPDLSKVRTARGDFHEGDLSKAMNKPGMVADVVDEWLEKGENRPTLCFAVDCAHARKLQENFIDKGVCAEYIDAFTEIEDREAIAKRFHAGEVKVVCNVGCLTTGIDWDVRCISLVRPTRSEILFVQMIGRGLRTAPGKDHCLILDHTDTHSKRLGFVTDIHHDTLNDGKANTSSTTKEREEPLPKECAKCGYLKPAKVHECPNCGFKPVRQSEIEMEDGVLVELSRQKTPAEKRKEKLNRTTPVHEKRRFYGELLLFASTHDYKRGWVSHKYKEKFGAWPDDVEDAPMVSAISPETGGWLISQNIRWAKRRQA